MKNEKVKIPQIAANEIEKAKAENAPNTDSWFLMKDKMSLKKKHFYNIELGTTNGEKPSKFRTKFTEKEIKAIDERYWAFAVPAEEVINT